MHTRTDHTRTPLARLRPWLVAACLMTAGGTFSAHAQNVIADDRFEDNRRTDGPDAADLTWHHGHLATGAELFVKDGALHITASESLVDTPVWAYLPDVIELAEGGAVSVEAVIRLTETVPDQGINLRVGLYNSGSDGESTRHTGDIGYNNHPARRNDRGFAISVATAPTDAERLPISQYHVDALRADPDAGNPAQDHRAGLGENVQGIVIQDLEPHTLRLTVRKTDAGIRLEGFLDDVLIDNGRDLPEELAVDAFDQVVLVVRSPGVTAAVESVAVTHTPTADPSDTEDSGS